MKPSEKRYKQFNIRLTQSEYDALEKIRIHHNKSIAEIFRETIIYYMASIKMK